LSGPAESLGEIGFVLQRTVSPSFKLFGFFESLAFAKTHTGAAPIFVDEFDPGVF
jgi:hypothetical protein